MDYYTLMELTSELGYRLAMSGAETFRIEESINRILAAYGIQSEVFAIPNCLTVTLKTEGGKSITAMKRIGFHGNDLDSVERYSNLSRRICTQTPDPETAMQWLKDSISKERTYTVSYFILGGFLAALGYCIFFGGSLTDALCAGLCGIIVVFANRYFSKLNVNNFFSTIATTFIFSVAAYAMNLLGLTKFTDTVIIGTMMILVPGLLFTNAMRDIIFGDTNSGINRIVQVLLIAAALALGTGAAWNLIENVFSTPQIQAAVSHGPVIQCIGCTVAGIGFLVLFNIHGPGGLLCTLGGTITWAAYCISYYFTDDEILSYFLAAVVTAIYAETMARVRKYPAISYLVISIFPLLPGAGIYYASNYIVRGDMSNFAATGTKTIAIAGCIAVGILTVSTIVRLWSVFKQKQAN